MEPHNVVKDVLVVDVGHLAILHFHGRREGGGAGEGRSRVTEGDGER
jgi:hypothetical protein